MPPDGFLPMLTQFALGYLAVLAVPGPNMLAIGAIAGVGGLRDALPAVLGLAAGALALAGGLHLLVGSGAMLAAPLDRIVPALLLAAAALWIARLRPPRVHAAPRPTRAVLLFCGACATAACNPLTGAYLAAWMIAGAAVRDGGGASLAMVAIAPLLTGGTMLVVAALFSRPAVRGVVAARHRPIRWCAAAVLGASALATLRPGAWL